MKKILPLLLLLHCFSCSKDDNSIDEKQEKTPEIFALHTSVSPTQGGTISGGEETYKEGEEVILTATPSEEYEFKEWQGGLTGTENPLKFNITSDKQIDAIFNRKTYSLEFNIVGKWYIQGSGTNNASTVKRVLNKQANNHGCSVHSIEFREDGTYILITAENETSGQFVVIGNQSIDLGIGKLEYLSFVNDVLSFTMNLDSGCSSTASALLLTYLPDDAFENELVRLGHDDVLDNFVETETIRTVKTLRLEPSQEILDYTGLEAFRDLEELNVWIYEYSSEFLQTRPDIEIDLTSNSNLKFLDLFGIAIKELDLSGNPLLEKLYLYYSALSGDLSFPHNPLLREVAINENYPQPRVNINLDFTHNPNLEAFSSDETWIGIMDISNSPNMKIVSIMEAVGDLITAGVYENFTYFEVTGSGPYRGEIIDFSKFPNLETLNIHFYRETIDLSTNLQLKSLHLMGAENLKSLDLSHNVFLNNFGIDTYYGQNFDCIKVNAEQLSKLETNEYSWPPEYTYSLDCS